MKGVRHGGAAKMNGESDRLSPFGFGVMMRRVQPQPPYDSTVLIVSAGVYGS